MPRFLVKYRKVLFVLMTVLAIAAALAVPHININTDMTRYMPDSYPMKQGLDLMEAQLPALQGQMQEFGSTMFADGKDLMPTDLPRTLAIGVGLLFLVLLVMCSSVMEVGLFLLTTGFAVVLNMGTNALFPSVSMITNTLTPVLQMVLSMDYSIILMNWYRQEKAAGKAPEAAMQGAVGGAASSILSSAFTTIVSLMMLCFIKFKIGADLGLVLSKGVAFSLLCNFTVLPFLILAADRAVEATRKKVPVFPAASLSRFAYRFRYPLTAVFLLVFATFAYLQRRTPLTFEPQWESTATDEPVGENAVLLVYPNSLEAAIPALMDTLTSLPGVHQGISYPSLVQRRRSPEEMSALFREFSPGEASAFPEGMLSLVYYARFHPQRTERLSFKEMMDLVEELQQQGLIPADFESGLDLDALFTQPEPPAKEVPVDTVAVEVVPAFRADTLAAAPADTLTPAAPAPPPERPNLYERYTSSYTAPEMAKLLQFNERQLTMLYRMAGRRNQSMTPGEMISFVKEKILPNKRYAAFMPKGAPERLAAFEAQLDSVLAAGPPPALPPAVTDTLLPERPLVAQATPAPADTLPPAPQPVEVPEVVAPPTPIEVLAQMAFSSMHYSSSRIHSALSAAGISVPKEQLDLLFLYSGARKGTDPEWKMSPEELLTFVADTLLLDPAFSGFVPDSTRALVTEAREELLLGVGKLRGAEYSGAVLLSEYPMESDSTFVFIDRIRALSDEYLPGTHYWIGESEMYKEMKEAFPKELLLLTLLTVLSIFLIVALTFRSVFIPIPLVMTVLSGIYVNVWASGLGGSEMYYLSYLIIQSILMGATIDYTILFTHYYLEGRRESGVAEALAGAYRGSSHSILTSGLILVVVPYVMFLVMKDPMIASILRSLSVGALAILVLVLFVLPGVVAALDRLMGRR